MLIAVFESFNSLTEFECPKKWFKDCCSILVVITTTTKQNTCCKHMAKKLVTTF